MTLSDLAIRIRSVAMKWKMCGRVMAVPLIFDVSRTAYFVSVVLAYGHDEEGDGRKARAGFTGGIDFFASST
jgi:hypothetical protein